ncbi:MAG: Phosphate uptake regulator PhoU [Thermoproteota archaeon]|nr:Phosphate uptake regulator PhoU [Thermoproteota archaeon]
MNETKPGKYVRRLQLIGGSTYILSLPKRWVTQMTLGKGSPVILVEQDDGSIVVKPENSEEVEGSTEVVIIVETGEEPDLITRKIASAYIVGYNVIRVRTRNERLDFSQRSIIKDFTRKKLVGTEIIADSSDEIVMKVLLSYPELSVESALRRMCVITSAMHRDSMNALKKLDSDLTRDVIDMDDEVDRFKLYIHRQLRAAIEDPKVLREAGMSTRTECLGYRLIIQAMERIADYAVEIAENALMLKKPLESELFEQIDSMNISAISMFNEAMKTLFSRNFQLANNIVQNVRQVALLRRDLMKSVLKTMDSGEASCLSLIVESITKIAEEAKDIAEVVLNSNIDQVITIAK